MRIRLLILLFIPLLVQGQYELKPDVKPMFRSIYEPFAIDTTIFYVDAINGDDSRSGNSPDSAWQTIAKVEGESFDAGDQILFNKGDTWRLVDDPAGTFEISWIGEVSNPIAISTYGTGDKPLFLGSDTSTLWTSIGDTLWYTVKASLDTFPSGRIFIELADGSVVWGILETEAVRSALDTLYEFYFNLDTVMLRWESATSPQTATTSVEIPQIDDIIELRTTADSAEYVTFDGLELAYFTRVGIRSQYPGGITGQTRALRGVEVRNCKIHHVGIKNSTAAFGTELLFSDVIIEDNEIYEIGRRGVSVVCDNAITSVTLGNYIMRNNYMHDGYHTTGFDINNVSNTCVYNGFEIYGNTIEDNPNASLTDPAAVGEASTSISIFLEVQAASTFEDINIYNNLFINNKAQAIQVGDVDTVGIFHNIFWGANVNLTTGTNSHVTTSGGTQDSLLLQNNIFYSTIENYECVIMANPTTTTIDYNLYFHDFAASDIIFFNSTGYNMSEWASWQALGHDGNSPTPADPLLANAPTVLKLIEGSVGIAAGLAMTEYTEDILGISVSNPPNLGAYEDTVIRADLISLTVSEHDRDTAIVDQALIGLGVDTIALIWKAGLVAPTSLTDGTEAFRGADTTGVDNLKITVNPTTDNDPFAFSLFGLETSSGVWSNPVSDTAAIDSIGSVSTLLTGLIAGWGLNETVGVTAEEFLDNFDGTYTNGPTLDSAGVVDRSVFFASGSSEFVDMGTSFWDPGTSDITVAAWTRVTDISGTKGITGNWGTAPYWYVRVDNARIVGVFRGSGANIETFSDAAVVAAYTWVHVIYEMDRSGNASMYINNVLQAEQDDISADVAFDLSNANTHAIGRIGNSLQYMNGLIDAVQVWSRLLTSDERAELYNSGSGREPPF